MVESEQDPHTGRGRIVLRPNTSLTHRQAFWLMAVLGLFMGTIAIGFATLGLWLVLPFSGAEWLLLAWCLRLSLRSNAAREVITIDDQLVVVEQGYDRPERTYRFQRAWVAVDRTEARIPGHPSRLFLRLHGRRVEIGRFLAESERGLLARELKQVLANGTFDP